MLQRKLGLVPACQPQPQAATQSVATRAKTLNTCLASARTFVSLDLHSGAATRRACAQLSQSEHGSPPVLKLLLLPLLSPADGGTDYMPRMVQHYEKEGHLLLVAENPEGVVDGIGGCAESLCCSQHPTLRLSTAEAHSIPSLHSWPPPICSAPATNHVDFMPCSGRQEAGRLGVHLWPACAHKCKRQRPGSQPHGEQGAGQQLTVQQQLWAFWGCSLGPEQGTNTSTYA